MSLREMREMRELPREIYAPVRRTFSNEGIVTGFQMTLTAEERECLIDLLEMTLNQRRIEEHRTRTLSYREIVLHQEDVLQGMLTKLRQ